MHARKPVHVSLATLTAAAALALSACGSDVAEDAASPAMTTVTEAATSTGSSAPEGGSSPASSANSAENAGHSGGQNGSGGGGGNGGGENCGVDPSAAAITDNIGQVPPPSIAGMTWTYKGDSNFDPCATLSYATVEQSEQGNAQFQNQLMLFHNGEYLGVGSTTTQQHSVVGTTDDSVTVAYKDYEALDAAGASNAEAANYTTNVTFRWDGSQVVPEGRFPNMSMQ